MATRAPLAIDKTIRLDINGSRQSIRLCAAHPGLRPLLIVQGGPTLPHSSRTQRFAPTVVD